VAQLAGGDLSAEAGRSTPVSSELIRRYGRRVDGVGERIEGHTGLPLSKTRSAASADYGSVSRGTAEP